MVGCHREISRSSHTGFHKDAFKKPQGIESIRDDSRSQAAWLNFSGGGQGIESTDSFLRKAFLPGIRL